MRLRAVAGAASAAVLLAACGGGGGAHPHASSLRLTKDWTTYHGDPSRRGYVATGPDPSSPRVAWRAALDGKVYASRLVVGGRVIAATENGTLYALDGTTGAVIWRQHLATPVPAAQLPCGNIDPVGITGTPVYDPQTAQLFAIVTTSGGKHYLKTVDVRSGGLRASREVDDPGSLPSTHLQRAALLLAYHTVYVAYGGNYGDCGQYLGRVAGVPVAGGAIHWFHVPSQREAGIWGASGPVAIPTGGVLVTTGNGQAFSGAWDHSDSLLKLSPTLGLVSGFAPAGWAQENSVDADLGSMGPLLLSSTQAIAAGKGGSVYLVSVANPGGVGHQLARLSGCRAFGGGAALPTSTGADAFLPCTDGVVQVHVAGNRMTQGWKAASSVTGSPVVVGHVLWSVQQNGTMVGIDYRTGKTVVSMAVGSATRFATPAVSGNVLLVPTLAGVTAVQLAP